MIGFLLLRKLSDEQKALIHTFAEQEKDVEGTVDGVAHTQTGQAPDSLSLDVLMHDKGEVHSISSHS